METKDLTPVKDSCGRLSENSNSSETDSDWVLCEEDLVTPAEDGKA